MVLACLRWSFHISFSFKFLASQLLLAKSNNSIAWARRQFLSIIKAIETAYAPMSAKEFLNRHDVRLVGKYFQYLALALALMRQ